MKKLSKKILTLALGTMLFASAMVAQVLPSAGVKNTLWSGFGQQFPEWKGPVIDPNSSNTRFYGLFETIQVNINVSQFSVEGMLNWAAETNWTKNNNFDYITFANTRKTPFYYTNFLNQGGEHTTGWTDSYYVNFIWNVLAKDKHDLDFGMGTRLAWKIGPAPACNGYYWEPYTHIIQGGLKEGAPGDADVVGYTHYDNLYANHALGVRYRFSDIIEAGISIPNGVTTNKPFFNAAFAIKPVDFFRASIAFEDVGKDTTDMYTGLSLFFKSVTVDAYLEIQDIGNDEKNRTWGTGATITLFPVKNLMLRPEAGVTFYRSSDYTPAVYGGGRVEWSINNKFVLGAFSSMAWGSKNIYWTNNNAKERAEHGLKAPYETTKKWDGGYIFDIRPDFTFVLDKHNSLSAALDYQYRVAYTTESYSVWATGVYWTYRK